LQGHAAKGAAEEAGRPTSDLILANLMKIQDRWITAGEPGIQIRKFSLLSARGIAGQEDCKRTKLLNKIRHSIQTHTRTPLVHSQWPNRLGLSLFYAWP